MFLNSPTFNKNGPVNSRSKYRLNPVHKKNGSTRLYIYFSFQFPEQERGRTLGGALIVRCTIKRILTDHVYPRPHRNHHLFPIGLSPCLYLLLFPTPLSLPSTPPPFPHLRTQSHQITFVWSPANRATVCGENGKRWYQVLSYSAAETELYFIGQQMDRERRRYQHPSGTPTRSRTSLVLYIVS